MKRISHRTLAAMLVAGGLSIVAPVGATEDAPSPFARQGKLAPIGEDTLSSHRGGAVDQQVNDQKLVSTVSGNHASEIVTGANVISDGAFGHVQGIPLVVQNSGNNVSIQNATILNITLK